MLNAANKGETGIVVAATIPALAVSAFCCANSRCRNFLKGVGATGSADLVLVRRNIQVVTPPLLSFCL